MVTEKKSKAAKQKARSASQVVEADKVTNRKRMAVLRKARSANQVIADRVADKKRKAASREARLADQVAVSRASSPRPLLRPLVLPVGCLWHEKKNADQVLAD
jgi:hypothetical protein